MHAAAPIPLPPDPSGPLPVVGAASGAPEVGIQQLLRPTDDLLLRATDRRRQRLQQRRHASLLHGLSQHRLRPCPAQCAVRHALRRRHSLQKAGGILPPQLRQHGTLLRAPGEHRPLQHEEEHIGVQSLLRRPVQLVQQRLEPFEIEVPRRQPQHRVPVQFRAAVRCHDHQLRTLAVLPPAVPHLIFGAAALSVLPVHLTQTACPAWRPWAPASTRRPPPAAARRAQTPC